jgi:predicted nucleic acid-binding protein
LYLDANVYLDYWENRSDNLKPLGEFAFSLLKRAIKCEFMVVCSEVIEYELCEVLRISRSECHSRFLKALESAGKLEQVETTDELLLTARQMANKTGTPYTDCCHLLLAQEAGAILVSRDNHFFNGGFLAKKPEEV